MSNLLKKTERLGDHTQGSIESKQNERDPFEIAVIKYKTLS